MDFLEGGDLRYYINRRYFFNEDKISKYLLIENL